MKARTAIIIAATALATACYTGADTNKLFYAHLKIEGERAAEIEHHMRDAISKISDVRLDHKNWAMGIHVIIFSVPQYTDGQPLYVGNIVVTQRTTNGDEILKLQISASNSDTKALAQKIVNYIDKASLQPSRQLLRPVPADRDATPASSAPH